ncbi:MAG: YlxR family protein [Lachnospiraceae bacterium]|nr:YlxR family protein [Lachnospiraceae bacterium]
MAKGKIPIRKCIGCGEMKPKKEMIRVILTPEGTIELDLTGKKNGRGAYICKDKSCLQNALKTHGLERSLKTAIPEEVAQELLKQLEENPEG